MMHFHAEPRDHPICVWERHLERRATPRLCRSTVVKNRHEFLQRDGATCGRFWMISLRFGSMPYNPLEVKAGLDVVELRRTYGNRLAFCGNMDVIA